MTTMAKARILVTRHLPPEVESRLERDFAASLNVSDRIMSTAEIAEKAKAFDGLLDYLHGPLPEGADRRPARLHPHDRDIFGGHRPYRYSRRQGQGHCRFQYARRFDRCDRRYCAPADAGRGAGRHLGRPDGAGEQVAAALHHFPLGHDVSGRRLGIYGMGRIGQAVAKRAAPLACLALP